MDATFGVNLAAGAMVKRDSMMIELTLKGEKTFDVLSLQEDIRVGQRVEKFVLEYDDHGRWKEIASGTTIGYKRLIRFPPVTAHAVRLRILSSRLNPTIAEFGLYNLAR